MVVNGRRLFDINPVRGALAYLAPSWVLKVAGIDTFFEPSLFAYFISVTRHIVDQRKGRTEEEMRSRKHHDLVQLLMDASADDGELRSGTYDQMTATNDDAGRGGACFWLSFEGGSTAHIFET